MSIKCAQCRQRDPVPNGAKCSECLNAKEASTPISTPEKSRTDADDVIGNVIEFIHVDVTCLPRKFTVTPQAKAKLMAIKTPLIVVGIAGPMRTGKSVLSNYIATGPAGASHDIGFEIGRTTQSCTKGLWIWGETVYIDFPVDYPTGQRVDRVCFLVLDTEGLFSHDQNAEADAALAALTMSLSSLFVWNVMKQVDTKVLEQLSFFQEITKYLRFKDQKSDPTVEELEMLKACCFPSHLIVCVRDFQHVRETSYTDDEYFNKILNTRAVVLDKTPLNQLVKDRINYAFPEGQRNCILFPGPTKFASDFNNLGAGGIKLDDVRVMPEFREKVAVFKDLVLRHMKVKKMMVNGRPLVLNGASFLATVESFCTNLSTAGAIPNILSAFDSIVTVQCKTSVEECFQSVVRQFDDFRADPNLILETHELVQLHRAAGEAALMQFDQDTVAFTDSQEIVNEWRTKLLDRIGGPRAKYASIKR